MAGSSMSEYSLRQARKALRQQLVFGGPHIQGSADNKYPFPGSIGAKSKRDRQNQITAGRGRAKKRRKS